ncbi:hypothetical protein M0811_09059 [Anaeramoeba ignava]|uniref:Uncharacterized protein n=1 Tax=Anaeramoeba ignava TaxID=1746090 RepID=A0A9Q0RAI3_ANAIG|nr:hypothetical protein M0811_09059 [Anaeramoeba ignava]
MKTTFVFLLLIFVSLVSAWDKNSFEISVAAGVVEYYSSDCVDPAYAGNLDANTCYPVDDHGVSSFGSDTSGYLYSYDSYNCTGSYTSTYVPAYGCVNLPNSGNLGSTFSVLLSLVSLLFFFLV